MTKKKLEGLSPTNCGRAERTNDGMWIEIETFSRGRVTRRINEVQLPF
jgi:hypothetical protein